MAKSAMPTPLGVLFPRSYAIASDRFAHASLECIVRAGDDARITAAFRCLRAGGSGRSACEHAFHGPVVNLAALQADPLCIPFAFAPRDDGIELQGSIELAAARLDAGLARVTLRLVNETELPSDESHDAQGARSAAMRRALLSTHLVLRIEPGCFVSPIEDRGEIGAVVRACRNVNTWPVLASAADDVLIGAAIVLPDHPELAPHEVGDRLDGAEIEEALLPRVNNLTDAERDAIRGEDPIVEAMIARSLSRGRVERA
jgi:hypothetical protein